MSAQVSVCSVNYWHTPPPDTYEGATVVALVKDSNIPVCFWFGRRDGVAIQANEREQKEYRLDDPNGTVPYIMAAARSSSVTRRFFKLEKPMTNLVDAFLWHYNKGLLNKRVKSNNFQLRGGGNMGEEEDDLLAALRIDDDEPDRAPAVSTAASKDESNLPPHRRSSPPDIIRSPDEYMRFLKSGH
ncbi:MAG: hypothetical protein GF334_08190 [Candidatus Altiarchaeales archaeon]|nr:hypothetical protein [Candidatus Altiarchaeales archaeon]